MKLGSHWLEIPPQVTPQQAADIRRNVVVGRTRKQLETFLTQDGGLFRAFHLERYLLRSGPSSGKVVKFNLEFKPEGMTDEVFRLGKWVAPSPKPGDVVMRVSPPYLEPAYFD